MSYHRKQNIRARRIKSGLGAFGALDLSPITTEAVPDTTTSTSLGQPQSVTGGAITSYGGGGFSLPTPSSSPSGSGSGGGVLDTVNVGLNAISSIFGQKPAGPVVVQQGGMSTTTMAILGIGALGLVLALTMRK